MNLDRILGQAHIKKKIYNSIEKNKYPQSKIIVDKDGYGGLNLAVEISKELLKEEQSALFGSTNPQCSSQEGHSCLLTFFI